MSKRLALRRARVSNGCPHVSVQDTVDFMNATATAVSFCVASLQAIRLAAMELHGEYMRLK